MVFQWDETKEETNKRKHGISFELASLVFADPLALTRKDYTQEEDRWQIIGSVQGVLVVLVVYTIREDAEETAIRIISARKASSKERRLYEEDKWFS
jgi:uncharacterized DUF497 family protein